MIIDDKGVRWSDDAHDAFETGSAIMAAVDAGEKKDYAEQIGASWTGDLVLVKELARTR
jgi:hypothetical protein